MRAKPKLNTYGRKTKKSKQLIVIERPILVQQTIFNINTSITNQFFCGNSTTSEDEFDKLRKGPSYQPSTSPSKERYHFSQRQESLNWYNSTASCSTSSSSNSGLLFKDLVASHSHRCNDVSYSTFTSPLSKHKSNRAKCKKPVFKRTAKKRKPRLSISKEYKSLTKPNTYFQHSTPTHPNLKVPKEQLHFQESPIMPLSTLPLAIENKTLKNEGRSNDNDISQLVAQLVQFRIKTPVIKDKTNSRKSLYSASPSEVNDRNKLQCESPVPTKTKDTSLVCLQNKIERQKNHFVCEKYTSTIRKSPTFKQPEMCITDFLKSSKITVRQSKSTSCKKDKLSSKPPSHFDFNADSESSLQKRYSKFEENENMSFSQEKLDNSKDSSINQSNEKIEALQQLMLSSNSLVNSDHIVKQENESNCTTQKEVPSKLEELMSLPPNCSSPITIHKASFQDQKLTNSRINLLPGKLWRRSFLQLKKTDTRRETVGPEILAKLKEVNLSNTRLSCINDSKSFLNVDESFLRKVSIRPTNGQNKFNESKTLKMGRQIDLKDIYEESLEETPEDPKIRCETNKLSLELIKIEESLTKQETKPDILDETPPIMKNNFSKVVSTITRRKLNKDCKKTASSCCDIEESGSPVLNQLQSPNKYHESYTSELLNISSKDLFNETPEYCTSLSPTYQSSFQTVFDDEDYLEFPRDRKLDPSIYDDGEEYLSGPITCKEGFLLRCGVDIPSSFKDVFTQEIIKKCTKIGEGVYGEVFMINDKKEKTVLKIIPIEGNMDINGTPQKKFDEVLSELITTEELSLLRENKQSNTSGFCQLKRKLYLQGRYPSELLDLWHEYDRKKKSYNECPDKLDPDNCFLALELEHAGQPVEDYEFNTAQQAYSVYLQVVFSLAAAEEALEFEHRDLHIGNILVKQIQDPYLSFTIQSDHFKVPSCGVKATIIDFTLSRISFMGSTLYYDLAKDPELFMQTGDYQFDIYRLMKEDLNDQWKKYQPKTNVRWLHYLLSKMVTTMKYNKNKKKTKLHTGHLKTLEKFMSYVQDFTSACEVAEYLLNTFQETVNFIVKE